MRYLTASAYLSAKGYVIKRLRAGKAFQEELARLEESQWLSAEELLELQNTKLRELVRHAYQHVPYYRRLFTRHQIVPAQIENVEDLKKIPTLSKETIRAQPDDFVSRAFHRSFLAKGWTTGSTGTPLCVYRTLASVIFDKATLTRQRRWAGVDIGDRSAAIWGTAWGRVIVSRDASCPPYWRFNAADNQLLFSYYHLAEETLPFFLEKLERFEPAFIEAFPSTALVLARFMRRRGLKLPVRAILTSSEALYDVHREEIECAFETNVFDYYGHAERAVTAAECERGNMHVNPEYGIVEILKGEEAVRVGERGEVVATGLSNMGMPLIRYRTGDVARLIDEPCPCGRASPLLGRIDGRVADFIRTPDGRALPGDAVMEAFYGIDNIKESQVVQEDIGHIVVKLVKDAPDLPVRVSRLRSNLETCMGKDLQLTIEFVDRIEDDAGPKRRWVVSKLQPEL